MAEPKFGGVKTLAIRFPDELHAQLVLCLKLGGGRLPDDELRGVGELAEDELRSCLDADLADCRRVGVRH